MRDLYNEQLEQLDQKLVQMGTMCQESISLAFQCMTDENGVPEDRVATMDDGIDRIEGDIESMCLRLLLKQQPVATDFRKVSSALKMITDLERIGDQAFVIAEISGYLRGRLDSEADFLFTMLEHAQKMLSESIDDFVKADRELAHQVIESDQVLDDLLDRVMRMLIDKIAQGNVDGEYALDVLMVAKCLERIGDHAANVAEWVEFSIDGTHE